MRGRVVTTGQITTEDKDATEHYGLRGKTWDKQIKYLMKDFCISESKIDKVLEDVKKEATPTELLNTELMFDRAHRRFMALL